MGAEHLARLHRMAEKRLGVLTRADLLRCGLTDRMLRGLVDSGVLVRMHQGVYRTATSHGFLQRALGACLTCGPHAVVSGVSALQVWELHPQDSDRAIDVSVPRAHRSSRPGIRVHRPAHLGPLDVTRLGPIPITRVGRSLRDAARVLGDIAIEPTLDEALRRRPAAAEGLLNALAEGTGVLRELALDRLGRGVPESELERLALRLIRRFGLPEPVRQHEIRVGGRTYRLDLAYPEHHVAVELMGRAPHWGKERWTADTDRRSRLGLAGWHVVELTWWDVTDSAADSAFKIGSALGLVPTRWRSAAR